MVTKKDIRSKELTYNISGFLVVEGTIFLNVDSKLNVESNVNGQVHEKILH
jgi:hypothetical protein